MKCQSYLYPLFWAVLVLSILTVNPNVYAQCASTTSTTSTPYNSNNGQRGVMFDVTANPTNNITVICFDANLYAGSTADYEIYYKAGTFQGFEDNSGAWTLVGTAAAVTSNGVNVPTPLPIPVNINILAGETYAFYITNNFGGGVSYTDISSPNAELVSNAIMTVNGGVGKSYPFGLTYNFRAANVTIHTAEAPLPVDLVSFHAALQDGKVLLTWTTASEFNNDYFAIERSKNGTDWEEIARVEGKGDYPQASKYTFTDSSLLYGHIYYRLKQIDFNGSYNYSRVSTVNTGAIIPKKAEYLPVFPNPASERIFIPFSKDETQGLSKRSSVGLYAFTGQQLDTPSYDFVEGGHFQDYGISLSIGHLLKGIYFIHIHGRMYKFIKQ